MAGSVLETLHLDGSLAQDDAFELWRCHSTPPCEVRPGSGSQYLLETLDATGRSVDQAEALVSAICVLLGAPIRYLSASIPLREAARRVRLRSPGRVLWDSEVLEPASLAMRMGDPDPARSRPVTLEFACSQAFEGASIQLFFEWAPNCSRVVDLFEPTERRVVVLDALPGGPRCRFWARYSNGMRSAMASSPAFALPPLPASVSILQPERAIELRPGQPLELSGQVTDPQLLRNAVRQGDLTWLLDGEVVGRGPIACVMEPRAGNHTVSLVDKKSGSSADVAILVRSLQAGEPRPAAHWDDR